MLMLHQQLLRTVTAVKLILQYTQHPNIQGLKTRTTTLKAIDIDNINTGIALAETSSGITLEDWLIKGYSTREVIAESHLSYSSPINAVTVYGSHSAYHNNVCEFYQFTNRQFNW